MDARHRHDWLLFNYLARHGSQGQREQHRSVAKYTSDSDVLRANHNFIRNERESDSKGKPEESADKLADAYWASLFKDFALADLSRYRDGQLGLRWRTENEVFDGKGQFLCGALGCDSTLELHSFEVPFVYTERGEKKETLVKLRLCGACAPKLFWHKAVQPEPEPSSCSRGGGGSSSSRRRSRSREKRSNGGVLRDQRSSAGHRSERRGK